MGLSLHTSTRTKEEERKFNPTFKMKLIVVIALLCACAYAAPVAEYECPEEWSEMECAMYLAPEDFSDLNTYGVIGDKALEIIVNRILKKLEAFDFLINLIPSDKVKNFIRENVKGRLEEVKALLEKGGFSLLKYIKDLVKELIAKFLS